MFVPFLFELRTVLDWMLVKTSLKFREWVLVESILAQVYSIRTERLFERDNEPRGSQIQKWKKILIGGGITLFLIVVLWFPLLLFAFSGSLGASNIPQEISISLHLGTYEPLYKSKIGSSKIFQFKDSEFQSVLNQYEKSSKALTLLKDFVATDFVAARFDRNSLTTWNISPPNKEKMVTDLQKGRLKKCRIEYKVTRRSWRGLGIEQIFGSLEVALDQDIRDKFVTALTSDLSDDTASTAVEVPQILPKILMVQNQGKFRVVDELSLGKSKRKNSFCYKN